eukprot:31209-Pelagococcus_subviridis.AAC.12
MNPDRATSPTPPDSNAHSVEFFEKLRSFLESTDENSSPSQRKSSDGEARSVSSHWSPYDRVGAVNAVP